MPPKVDIMALPSPMDRQHSDLKEIIFFQDMDRSTLTWTICRLKAQVCFPNPCQTLGLSSVAAKGWSDSKIK